MNEAQGKTADEGALEQSAGELGELSTREIRVVFVGRRSTAVQVEAPLPTDGLAAGASAALGSSLIVVPFTNQRSALRLIRKDPPHALLIELEPRPASRLHFCSLVRSRLPALAILALGEEAPEGPAVLDGFLPLPLSYESVAHAIERVRGKVPSHILKRGPFQLNVATRTLYTPRGSRHMTPKQCALLEMLMRHHNEVVCRSDIMAAIWETSYLDDTRTLDVHIRWLRESIEQDPSSPLYLLTVRGQGYTFQAPERGALS